MVIIRMTGGLGNQMFQYALYLRLCSMGREVKFDDVTEYELENARPIMLWAFDISYPRASREEINKITDGSMKLSHRIRRKLSGRRSLEYSEESYDYDGQVLERDPAYLTGYFQSEKYFTEIQGQVRRAFTFSDKIWDGLEGETKRRVRDCLERIRGCESVSVHIRRGDYLEKDEIYGGICTEEYYREAFRRILKRFPQAVFFVFSNDEHWVREWIPGLCQDMNLEKDRFITVEGTTEETGYLDLFLMSRCRNHIIANSSFSWWGAWLGENPDKMVLAPAVWVRNCKQKDIYTDRMIRINAEGILTE